MSWELKGYKEKKFKLGDWVTITINPIGPNFKNHGEKRLCKVDRLYKRKSIPYVRLKLYHNDEIKLINAPVSYCDLNLSKQRDEKLKELGIC